MHILWNSTAETGTYSVWLHLKSLPPEVISHLSSKEPLQGFRINICPSFPTLRCCSHYCFQPLWHTSRCLEWQQAALHHFHLFCVSDKSAWIFLRSILFSSTGKALVDVLVLGSVEQSPPVKDLLPLLGALKHMSCWHAAKITVVTQHISGWEIPQARPFLAVCSLFATRGR